MMMHGDGDALKAAALRRLRRIENHLTPDREINDLQLELCNVDADSTVITFKPAMGSDSGLFGYIRDTIQNTATSLRFGYNFGRVILNHKINSLRAQFTMADAIEDAVEKFPGNPAILYREEKYTFAEMNREANRIAHWGLHSGLKQGDVVALVMQNRPEFIFTWFGMAKIGVTTALINTNLEGNSLYHVLNVSTAKIVIIGAELVSPLMNIRDRLDGWDFWVFRGTEPAAGVVGTDFKDLDVALSFLGDEPIPKHFRDTVTLTDPLFYIYTSGTTGLPKPCKVAHKKVYYYMEVFSTFGNFRPSDRLYISLPMYHSNGGMLPTSVWRNGGAMVISRKFSASKFWDDTRKYNATIFVYIGEVCRYLNNQPPRPNDGDNPVRLMFGNGFRADIWDGFRQRFKIPTTLEFYGSTEGNVGLLNITNKKGACGQLPGLAKHVLPVKIIKYDVESESHPRDSRGCCIVCDYGEVGEAVGRIESDPNKLTGGFDGYASLDTATEKKILRDVFEKGDAYFRTGDLMAMDANGYFYFVDRIGDTFRWKGENVATSEVEQCINDGLSWVAEVTVYGVQIPGKDGRAGMAAIGTLDDQPLSSQLLDELCSLVRAELPSYARPLFVRQVTSISTTTTFKHNKAELVRQGCDPVAHSETIHFFDSREGRFVPLDTSLWKRICAGEVIL